jgi:hypothetical protein
MMTLDTISQCWLRFVGEIFGVATSSFRLLLWVTFTRSAWTNSASRMLTSLVTKKALDKGKVLQILVETNLRCWLRCGSHLLSDGLECWLGRWCLITTFCVYFIFGLLNHLGKRFHRWVGLLRCELLHWGCHLLRLGKLRLCLEELNK